MRLIFVLLAAVLAMAICAPQPAAAWASVRYYENGKQIPTPVNLPPVYPARERKRRIGGTTIVACSYDEDGKVVSASVKQSSGNQNLDAAAVAAVKQWTVQPKLKDGNPVAGETEMPVSFTP